MQHRGTVLGLLLVGTSAISMAQSAGAASAAISSPTRFYDIPSQSLGTALNHYAEMTGVDLVVSPQMVRGKRSHPVRGNYSPDGALDQLLRGSTLLHRTSAGGSVIVEAPGEWRASAAEGDPQPVMLAQNVPPVGPTPTADVPASAQTPQPDAESAIVVTGVRGSLQRARDLKRNANGVVDAVSAEDIGKFPDTNLAESLQRVPGVSIERRAGEGTEVTVRGFGPQFNLITINGRQLATTDVSAVGGDQDVDFSRATSRSFDFSNLASEGVSRLEVYKTGRAAVPTGGIGATINIVTARPLDGPVTGFRGSIGAKANYDSSLAFGTKSLTPEASGVLNWSDPNKRIGVSVFGEYSKRKWAAASATSNDWNIMTYNDFLNTPGMYLPGHTQVNNAPDGNELIAIPNDSRYDYSTFQRERINLAGTLQFRPIDSLTITADGLYAQNKVREERTDQGNWFNRPFDTVTFDDNPDVATAVRLSEGSLYPTKDIGFENQYRATKTKLHSLGLNANWQIVPGLTLNLDGNTSKSSTLPDAPNGASSTLLGMGAYVVDGHSVDFTGDIPHQDWTFNDCEPGHGNCNGVLDFGDVGSSIARTNASAQTQKVKQYRADLGWDVGSGIRFDAGASRISSTMISTQVQTQQQLGDWGINHPGDVTALAGDVLHQFCMACMFDHYSPTDADIGFRGNALDLYEILSPAYAADGNPLTATIDPGNPVNVTSNSYDRVHERVTSIYGMASWHGNLGGIPASVVAGARYERTKVNSFARVTAPTAIVWNSDNDFSRIIGTDTVDISLPGKYHNFLPSIDFKIEPARGLVARASASRTLSRPDYGNLFASQSANGPNRPTYLGGVATGSSGNPNLQPLLSTNFDVSLEYYYGKSNYVSAGFFYKNVKNFVGQGVFNEPLFGLRDPTSGASGTLSGTAVEQLKALNVSLSDVSLFTYTALLAHNNGNVAATNAELSPHIVGSQIDQSYADSIIPLYDITATSDDPLFNFAVTTPINNHTGKIHGFELQAQHFFGNSGFGLAGSLTKVLGDVNYDPASPPGTNVFALTGLSDSANATAIFEKYGISARIAYNWRGEFLQSVNNGSSRNPRYFAPYGTLDGSIEYDIGRNVAISFDVQNMLSEPLRMYGRTKRELFFAQEGHPHFALGARFRFGGPRAMPMPPVPPMLPPPPPATQTCPDGTVIDATATCPAPPPPPAPPATPAPERGL